LFLTHPAEAFYIRQIARLTGETYNNVRGLSAGFGGDQWRPFVVHVDDAAEAILKCLEAPLHVVN